MRKWAKVRSRALFRPAADLSTVVSQAPQSAQTMTSNPGITEATRKYRSTSASIHGACESFRPPPPHARLTSEGDHRTTLERPENIRGLSVKKGRRRFLNRGKCAFDAKPISEKRYRDAVEHGGKPPETCSMLCQWKLNVYRRQEP